ncbi:MAG: stage III sporulation protein AF [Hespellia sp.]|nr:stage III sporulation protein AF [Hespellia sp.]
MTTYLYEWLKKISFYSILVTVVLQIVPNESYRKYVRFVTGLIFVVILSEPVFAIFQIRDSFYNIYHNEAYYQQELELKAAEKYMEELEVEP